MRVFAILIASCAALNGCDAAMGKVASQMSGEKLIVVASAPITLSDRPTEITPHEPMEVLGEWTSVCVVLKDGVPLADSQTMDSKFTEAMHNSKVNVAVVLNDGSRRPMSAPTLAWLKSGAILRKDELSGCASAGCLPHLPKGALVTKVLLSSEPELRIQGVYWASSPDLSPKKPSEPAKTTTSSGTGRSCG